jgi:predicted nucleotidyltransferase
MVEPEILTSVKRYLRAIAEKGVEPAFGILFGSQVTGKANEWSDIDLVVVAPIFDTDYKYKDVASLWGTAGVIDSRIEPIPCGVNQWENDNGTPIIWIARKEGVMVTFKGEGD